MIKNLNTQEPLYCDTETNQFFSKIRLVQVFQEHWDEAQLFDIRDVDLEELYLEMKQCTTVWHNYAYDAACFVNDLELEENPFPFFEDTLILAKLGLYNKIESNSLDSCLEYVHGYDVYGGNDLEKKVMQKSFVSTKSKDMSKADLTEDQLKYAAADVYYLPKLFNYLKDLTEDYIYQLDKTFLRTSQVWQKYGVPVDQDRLQLAKLNTQAVIDEQTELLPQGLNINSPKQVQEVTGMKTNNDLALAEASARGDEFAAAIREKRKMIKRKNFLARFSFDRVKGYFAPTTVSGRARCQGDSVKPYTGHDNLMQQPRELKHLFGFTEEDPRYLVYSDFAQLELRTIAAITGDTVMETLFKEGKDLHIYAAEKIFNEKAENIDKQLRFTAKMCNFGLLYGCGWKTFGNILMGILGTQPDNLEEIVIKWKTLYPGVIKWQKKGMNQQPYGSNKPLFGKTLNGRNYRARIATDLLGVENQGTGAEAAKLAMHYFFKKEPKAKLLNFVHDSFIIEAANLEEGKRLAKSIADAMVEAWAETIKSAAASDIPMPTEALVGKNLGDIDNEGIYAWRYFNDGTI